MVDKSNNCGVFTAILVGIIAFGLVNVATLVLVITKVSDKTCDECTVTQNTTIPNNPNNSTVIPGIAKQFLSSVNFSADPCENFYEYACGQWQYQHWKPSYRTSWSQYALVSQGVSDLIRSSIEKADLSSASEGLTKAKHFYDSCMNVAGIQVAKGTQLGHLLHTGTPEDSSLPGFPDGTGKWPLIDASYEDSSVSIEQQVGHLKGSFGIDTYFLAYALQYSLNAEQTILWLTPTMLPLGIGMFTQQYYLSPKLQYIRDAYQKLQKNVGVLLARDSGFTNVTISDTDLKDMLDVEIAVANLTNTYSYDIEIASPSALARIALANNNLWSLKELNENMPDLNWNATLASLLPPALWQKVSTTNDAVFLVDYPEYFDSIADLFHSAPRRALRNYEIWRLIKYSLPYMSTEYTDALAEFTSVLTGQNVTAASQEAVCLSYVKGNYEMPNLSFATAEAVVTQHPYISSDKEKVTDMVAHVRAGLTQLIKDSTWMDNVTKNYALFKAAEMDALISYPDWILNKTAQAVYYQDLKTPNASFIALNLMLRGWAVEKQLLSVDQPYDRSEFIGTPLETDAWYSESTNTLTVPLGELQEPFFGDQFPAAVNYGAVGAVCGHEMSHGFDLNGAQYNAFGNLSNWWSPESETEFKQHAQCIVNQFNKYCIDGPSGPLCVNGSNTIDENIADLAGLKASYQAFANLDASQKAGFDSVPFWSADQVFFLSFASFWCGVESTGDLQNTLLTDVHSPPRFRVIGTLRNIPEFATAFNCPAQSYMNPQERCSIW